MSKWDLEEYGIPYSEDITNQSTNNTVALQPASTGLASVLPGQYGFGIDNSILKARGNAYNSYMANGGTPKTETGWFGKGGYLDSGAQIVNAGSGLMNAWTGVENLGLAKKKFAAEQKYAATNLANQADLTNEQRATSGNVGLALAGGTMNDAQKLAARNKIAAGNVARTI